MEKPPKLSRQQQHILVFLYHAYLEDKAIQNRPEVPLGCRTVDTFGVRWRTKGTRSDQTSLSRALRRLEERGLVLRQNQVRGSGEGTGRCRLSKAEEHNRTTHVRLLPDGIEVAERLSTEVA